ERLRRNGPHAGGIEKKRLPGGERVGVDRLRDQQPSGRERAPGFPEEREDRLGCPVLDDLQGHDGPEGARRPAREQRGTVPLLDIEPFGPALAGCDRVDLDARSGDAALGEEMEEFAAAAADVENGARKAGEKREVELLLAGDLLRGPAEALLEEAVHPRRESGRGGEMRRRGGAGRRKGARRGRGLQAREPAVLNRGTPFPPGAGGLLATDRLLERPALAHHAL